MAKKEATVKEYLIIFAVLMVLLVLTVAAAYLELGAVMAVVVALAIAFSKATLIIMFFMHVKYKSRLIWVFACGGFFWFLFLIGLTFMDYTTRDPWQHGVMDSQNEMATQSNGVHDNMSTDISD